MGGEGGGAAGCTSSVCSSSSSVVCWGSWEGSPGGAVGVLLQEKNYHEDNEPLVLISPYLDACTGLDEVPWAPYHDNLPAPLLPREELLEPGGLPGGSQAAPSPASPGPAVSAGPGGAQSPSAASDIPH